jgi:hypothetical protein
MQNLNSVNIFFTVVLIHSFFQYLCWFQWPHLLNFHNDYRGRIFSEYFTVIIVRFTMCRSVMVFSIFYSLTRYCYLKVTKFSSRVLGNVNIPNSVDGNEHIPWPSGEHKFFEKLLAQFPPLLTFWFLRTNKLFWTCSFSQYFLWTMRKLSTRTNLWNFLCSQFFPICRKFSNGTAWEKKQIPNSWTTMG